MLGRRFVYGGDDGSQIGSRLKELLGAIALCLQSGFPEGALVLLYSGIDTLGLLAAAQGTNDASRKTFEGWCQLYLVPRLKSIEGQTVAPEDLWSARCGVLHTSTPVSKLSREGKAHELWYRFQGRMGVNLSVNAKLEPLGVEIEKLAVTFQEASLAFISDLGNDPIKRQNAEDRAQRFLRWCIETWHNIGQ